MQPHKFKTGDWVQWQIRDKTPQRGRVGAVETNAMSVEVYPLEPELGFIPPAEARIIMPIERLTLVKSEHYG